MTDYTTRAGLDVDASLAKLLERDVLTLLGRDIDAFWAGFADLCDRFRAAQPRIADDTRDDAVADRRMAHGAAGPDP